MTDKVEDELVSKIGVEVDARKINEAIDSLNKVTAGMLNIKSAVMKTAPVLVELFAAFEASNVTKFSAAAETMDLTTNQLRALQLAARNAGLDVGSVTGVISNLRNQLLGYQTGNAPTALLTSLAKANSLLHTVITPLDKGGHVKSAYQLFTDIATAIGKIKDPTQQAAASVSILGTNLVPLLKNGMGGINQAYKELSSRKLFLGDDEIDKMKSFNTQMQLMREEVSSFGSRLAIALIPILEQFNKLLTNPKNMKQFTDSLITLAKAAVILAKALGPLVELFNRGVGKAIDNREQIKEGKNPYPHLQQEDPFHVKDKVANFFTDTKVYRDLSKILSGQGVGPTPEMQAQSQKTTQDLVTSLITNQNNTNNNQSSNTSNVVNHNITNVNLNNRKSMLSIPTYAGAIP